MLSLGLIVLFIAILLKLFLDGSRSQQRYQFVAFLLTFLQRLFLRKVHIIRVMFDQGSSVRCDLRNLLDAEPLEEINGIGICSFGGFVKLVDLFFSHRRPVPRYLLLIEVEIIFEVPIQVVVDIPNLGPHDGLELFVTETAASIDVLLCLLLRFKSQLIELVADVVAAQLDHRLVLALQFLPEDWLGEHLPVLQSSVHEGFDLLPEEGVQLFEELNHNLVLACFDGLF